MTLTPYDFSAITSLKLGGDRIEVTDSISSVEIRGLLGVMPTQVKSKNVPLIWLYSNIDKCETTAIGTRMFMLLFIGTFLCPDLGSTVSLHYLWSLRDINQIKNYDWGSMAYATILHFVTQFSRPIGIVSQVKDGDNPTSLILPETLLGLDFLSRWRIAKISWESLDFADTVDGKTEQDLYTHCC